MLKRSQTFLTAALGAILLISLLMSPTSVSACEEPPATLLKLYLGSDLVIIANYKGEKSRITKNDDEYGVEIEIQRELSITEVIKGQKGLKRLVYDDFEYQPKIVEETAEEEFYEHFDYDGLPDAVELRPGQKYLFFFTQQGEKGDYYLTDYYSGVQEMTGQFSIVEKRLRELKTIVDNRENQLPKLTEWLVANIEEPLIRYHGVNDLAESFYSLTYDQEAAGKTDPSVLDQNFSTYTPALARNLTGAQKYRISAVLMNVLQDSWFGVKAKRVDPNLAFMASRWDKSRLAVYGFNSMKSVGRDDFDRKLKMMDFITNVVDDESLSSIYYDYSSLSYQMDRETKKDDPKEVENLKTNIEKRKSLAEDFDKQFRLLYGRNFVSVKDGEQ